MTPLDSHLINTIPALKGQIERYPLVSRVADVRRLKTLEKRTGAGSIWFRSDHAIAKPMGGGATRKLEWIFGKIHTLKSNRLMLTGPCGSELILAAAAHAEEANLGVLAVTYPSATTARIDRINRATISRGAQVHPSPHRVFTPISRWLHTLRHMTDPGERQIHTIPFGAFNVYGAIGFIEAAFELAQQVTDGLLPRPSAIFMPGISGTSAAGLQLGCKMAGLETRVVAVDTAGQCKGRRMCRLANRTAKFLEQSGAGAQPRMRTDEFKILSEFDGGGFGHTTGPSQDTVALLKTLEHLTIASSNSAKAFGGMLRQIVDWSVFRDEPVLFWDTSAASRFKVSQS